MCLAQRKMESCVKHSHICVYSRNSMQGQKKPNEWIPHSSLSIVKEYLSIEVMPNNVPKIPS